MHVNTSSLPPRPSAVGVPGRAAPGAWIKTLHFPTMSATGTRASMCSDMKTSAPLPVLRNTVSCTYGLALCVKFHKLLRHGAVERELVRLWHAYSRQTQAR